MSPSLSMLMARCPSTIRATAFASVVSLMACNGEAPLPSPAHPAFQAISLTGDTLNALPLPADTHSHYEDQLAEARRAYEHTPANADSIVWYGRRLGYLGQYREAIEVFSKGLTIHPDDPRLYRHRGHRYISVREFAAAVADLTKASDLVVDQPDLTEPDGQPNAQNIPVSTLQSNIRYHLALAHYLLADFDRAAEIAQSEVSAADNDDRTVAMAHWLYMSLRRAGRDSAAEAVLAPITRDMGVIENHVYHRLLLLYKGLLPLDSLFSTDVDGTPSVTDVAAAYGVGNWYWYNGRRDQATAIWRRIVDGGQWAAFGAIAAEAELARLEGLIR